MGTSSSPDSSVDMAAKESFEKAWKDGIPCPIEAYLPENQDDPRFLPTLLELIKSELWFSWKRFGDHAGADRSASALYGTMVKQYLERFPCLLAHPQHVREIEEEEYRDRDHFKDVAIQPKASIPGYEILGEVGRGGMGVVYKARHHRLNRVVALKVIQGVSRPTEAELARFRTETEAMGRLQNPHIVQVFEVGEHDGQPFCALEFVNGGTLAEKIKDKPLSVQQAATFAWLLAKATHAAHEQKVIHRDLKPSNVLVTDRGMLKIADFGLAKLLDRDSGHTRSVDDFGTAPYMAPEQAKGKNRQADARTDVYALGTILYEMLTGKPPFSGETRAEIVEQVCIREPEAPTSLNPKVPRDLDTICRKCLLKEPDRRYADAEVLADDLERFRSGKPIKARPVGRWERCWYWCRRNPRLASAGAIAAAAAMVALVFGAQALFLTRERKQLQADVANQEQETRRAERNRQESDLRKLHVDLESSHSAADKLFEQAAARKMGQATALAAIEKAMALEAEGKKVLAALGPSADPVSFASRWEKRKIALRNEATWYLTALYLRPLKSLRLPDLKPQQQYSASVDSKGTRVVVIYGANREGLMIDPRTLEVRSLPLPESSRPAKQRSDLAPLVALSPDGSQLGLGYQVEKTFAVMDLSAAQKVSQLPLPKSRKLLLTGSLRFLGDDRIELKGQQTSPDICWEKRNGTWQPSAPSAPAKGGARTGERLLAIGRTFDAVNDVRGSGLPSVRVRPRAGGPDKVLWRDGEASTTGPGANLLSGPFGMKVREFFHQAVFAPDSDLLYILTSHRLLAVDAISTKRIAGSLPDAGPLVPSKKILAFTGGVITLEPLFEQDPDGAGKFIIPYVANGPTPLKLTVWTTAMPRLGSRLLTHDVPVRCLSVGTDGLLLTGAEDRQIRSWGKESALLGEGTPFGAAPLPPADAGNKNWVSALHPCWELTGPDKQRLLIKRTEISADPRQAFGRPRLIRTEIYDAGTGRLLHTFPAAGPGRLLRIDAQPPQPVINGSFSRSVAPSVRSLDGKWTVVVAGEDSDGTNLELWSLESCKLIGSLGRVAKPVGPAAMIAGGRSHAFFSPDGRWLLVGQPNSELGPGAVRGGLDYNLWQVRPLKRLGTIRLNASLLRCDFSPDEKQAVFLYGSPFGGVLSGQLIDFDRGGKAAELFSKPFRGSPENIIFAKHTVLVTIRPTEVFSPASGGAYLFSRETGKRIVLGDEKWQQGPFAIPGDHGKRLLLYGIRRDKNAPGKTDIELWDVPGRKLLRQAAIPTQLVLTPFPGKIKNAFADHDRIIFSRVGPLAQGNDRFVALRWSDGEEVKAPVDLVEVEDLQAPWSLWSYYKGLSLFHAGRGKRIHLEKSFGTYSSLTISASDERLFIQGGSRVRSGTPLVSGVWDTFSGKRLLDLPTAHFLGFDGQGKRVLTLDPATKAVAVYDLESGKAQQLKLPAPLEPASIGSGPPSQRAEKYVALLNAKGNLLVAPMQGQLQIWDLKNNRPAGAVDRPGHTAPVTVLAQHTGAGLIVSGGDDGIINLWQHKDGKFLRSLGGHTSAIVGLAFSADGQHICSASADGSTVCWKTIDGSRRWHHPDAGVGSPVQCLAMTPDGDRLALGLQDGTVALLSAEDGKTIASVSTGPARVLALAFSTDGRTLALGGLSGQLRLFTGASKLEPGAVWQAGDSIQSLCFTPAGRYLLVGGRNIQLWEMRSGKPVWQIELPRGPVRALSLNPATDELLIADQGNQVAILPLGEWLRRLADIRVGIEDVFSAK